MKLNFFSREGNLKASPIGNFDASTAWCLKRHNRPSHGLRDILTKGQMAAPTDGPSSRSMDRYSYTDLMTHLKSVIHVNKCTCVCLSVCCERFFASLQHCPYSTLRDYPAAYSVTRSIGLGGHWVCFYWQESRLFVWNAFSAWTFIHEFQPTHAGVSEVSERARKRCELANGVSERSAGEQVSGVSE